MSWREKSFEVLPALSVRGKELRHSLRLVTAAWMVGVIWSICVGGDQMRAFAHIMGFNDFAFGLMGAIPFIATLGQLPAAILVERTGLRKYLFFSSGIASRLLWMVLAAVPLVFWPGREGSAAGVIVALGIIFASNFLAHIMTPPWWTWMGDLVPRRIRGRYFAKRTQMSTVAQIAAIIVISLILRHVGAKHNGGENAVDDPRLLITICIIFAVGAILGSIDIWLFRKIREIRPPRSREFDQPSFVFNVARPARWTLASGSAYVLKLTRRICEETLLDPLKDRVFRNYVYYGATITFSLTCCGWFYWKYASESLGFDAMASNIVFLAIGPVAATITSPWWGKMVDRWGRRPTLVLATVLMAISTVPWFVTWRDMPCPQMMADAINGVAWAAGSVVGWVMQGVHYVWPAVGPSSGSWVWVTGQNRGFVVPYALASLACILGSSSGMAVGLASSAIVLGFSDGHGRSKFVAASSILINIGGALGGVVGGMLAEGFKQQTVAVASLVLNNYQMTFALGMVVRVLAMGFLWNMPDPGARKVRDLLKVATDSLYNVVTSRMFLPLRIVGWGRSSKDAQSRKGLDKDKPADDVRETKKS